MVRGHLLLQGKLAEGNEVLSVLERCDRIVFSFVMKSGRRFNLIWMMGVLMTDATTFKFCSLGRSSREKISKQRFFLPQGLCLQGVARNDKY